MTNDVRDAKALFDALLKHQRFIHTPTFILGDGKITRMAGIARERLDAAKEFLIKKDLIRMNPIREHVNSFKMVTVRS